MLSLEAVAAAAPEAVVFSSGEIPSASSKRFLAALRAILGRPVKAVMVPADLLVRPGPRSVEAIEMLAESRRSGVQP